MKKWLALTVVLTGVFLAVAAYFPARTVTRTVVRHDAKRITVYVQDKAPQYISVKQIRRDIPAWEKSVNGAFSQAWNTPQVRIKLGKAPYGAISAVFVSKGSIQGALAYHRVYLGVPQIVVYAGTGDYYGYSNSVSFTHELFELLADPTISQINQGRPDPVVFVGNQPHVLPAPVVWFNEVCDPVEAYSYAINHVQISDWITPNWFNDGMGGSFDYMGEVHQPLTILRGGYAQFWNGFGWQAITDWRHAGRDANGFLKAEGRR